MHASRESDKGRIGFEEPRQHESYWMTKKSRFGSIEKTTPWNKQTVTYLREEIDRRPDESPSTLEDATSGGLNRVLQYSTARRNRGMCSRPNAGVQAARSGGWLPIAGQQRANYSPPSPSSGRIQDGNEFPSCLLSRKESDQKSGWICDSDAPQDETVQGGAASPWPT